ncbi:MAG: DUF4912 domain-containing protein [Leptospiraceae bacterium]|nr:DUF4912 domain-containing protein [Leptospiraceae bacterium]
METSLKDNSEKKRIYLDPALDKLPEYYDRDIIKVLTKNPKEVFIFWGVSLSTQDKITDFFQCSKEEISYSLKISYQDEAKNHHKRDIALKAFTTSYLLKFDSPVKNLKAELVAFQNEKFYSTLHSASINLPSNQPSKLLDKNWVKREWILEEGVQFIFGNMEGLQPSSQEILVLSNQEKEKLLEEVVSTGSSEIFGVKK